MSYAENCDVIYGLLKGIVKQKINGPNLQSRTWIPFFQGRPDFVQSSDGRSTSLDRSD